MASEPTDETGEELSRDQLLTEVERLRGRLAELEAAQVDEWIAFVGGHRTEIVAHQALVNDMRNTLSWRITKPIRRVRGLGRR